MENSNSQNEKKPEEIISENNKPLEEKVNLIIKLKL